MDKTRVSLLMRLRDPRDNEAWSEFDRIYRPLLTRYACARGLTEADVEDVVQYSMAQVHNEARKFEYDPTRGRFRGWLRTVVNNRVNNIRRQPHFPPGAGDLLARQAADGDSPEELFERIWFEEHLRHALLKIKNSCDGNTFEAFRLYVVEEHPSGEVCDRLGIDRQQLYKIKWRLTRKLREHFAALTGEEPDNHV